MNAGDHEAQAVDRETEVAVSRGDQLTEEYFASRRARASRLVADHEAGLVPDYKSLSTSIAASRPGWWMGKAYRARRSRQEEEAASS